MIKNILYSLFLHSLLLLLVYANFNLKNNQENRTSEVSVSLISVSGNEDAQPTNKNLENSSNTQTKEIKKPKKEASNQAKSDKKSNKNKVASLPKKSKTPKTTKSVAKSNQQDPKQTVKETEKIEKQQQENGEEKIEDETEKDLEEKKNETPRKDQDIGAETNSENKKDADSQEEVQKNSKASQAKNLDNIDLSAREKYNIQSQLKRCYARAVAETNYNNNEKITLQVSINEEGVINSDIEDAIDLARYNNPKEINYKIAIDNARRAIELCSPIRNLPSEKYEIWKEVILDFGNDN